jgi:hypothetical protein
MASKTFPVKRDHFAGRFQWTHLFQAGIVFVFAAYAILMPSFIAAQTLGSGSIQGTVTDQSGAAVPVATVTATETDTGRTITARTTSAGFYDLPNLEPGQYSVAVNAQGFEKQVQNNVTVVAFGTAGLNMQLKVGSASETVTVGALAPQINTTNGTLETEIPHDVYNALPIAMANGPKSPLGFVSLAPGVNQGGNATFKMNGGAAEASQMYLNGMPAPEALIGGDLRTITGATPLEAVSDSQVLTSGIPAYYSGAGVVNLVLKSGTNQFHGNIYENIRNTAFDAAGYFASKTPVEHQNEFGTSIGGPIMKNRMFFFFNYDGYRLLQGQNPQISTIPTLAERQGDFSALPVPIYDPSTTQCVGNVCTRQQFPGNIIPASEISPVSKFLESQLPQPINSSIVNNYVGAYNDGFNQNMYLGKLDYSITKSNRLSFVAQAGSVTDSGLPETYSSMLPLPYASGRYGGSTNKLYQVKDTQTITPNLVNVFGYQFNSFDSPLVNGTTSGNWATKAGLAGTPSSGLASQDFPPVTFAGPNSPGPWAQFNFSASQDNYTRVSTFQDNLQWVRGKHDLTFGGMWQPQVADQTTPSQITSDVFSNLQTSGYSPAGAVSTTQGNAYASYLLGAVDAASLYDTAVPKVRGRFSNYALFLQDDWQATQKLTVNLGIRWTVDNPFTEADNKLSFLNPDLPNPAVSGFKGALQFAGNGPDSCNCSTPVVTRRLNFEPRVGFAFNPIPGTVIRGSYSNMNFKSGALGGTTPDYGQLGYAANPSFNPPNTNGAAAFNWNSGYPGYQPPPFIDPTLNTGYNTTTGPNGGAVTYADPQHAGYPSYTQYWNLTLEQQLTPTTALSISYAGSLSHRLALVSGYGIYSDQLDPKYLALGNLLLDPANAANIAAARAIIPGIGPQYANFDGSIAQMLRPFPQYSGVNDQIADYGSGHYNSMQVVADHIMSRGFFYHFVYTWNREINNSGGENARPNTAAATRNAYDPNLDRTVSAAPNQVFTGALTYALPIGQGHFLSFENHVLNNLVGNWKLSAIVSYNDGGYLGPFTSVCRLPNAGSCYADYNPAFTGPVRINGGYGSGNPKSNPVPYINVNAFQNAADYTYGTTPRHGAYSLRNPGGANEEVAVDKIFTLRGPINLRLRADAFNVFNRTIFGGIITNINSPGFGTVTAQANAPRQLQFEAYFNF